ncbi:hypothetical protein MJO29_010691 [Puccinia striiformis f. sp. tritici]|nr:hypothetical protein MJO29_010691 [Puccinia striiformis f. sp. tritici]
MSSIPSNWVNAGRLQTQAIPGEKVEVIRLSGEAIDIEDQLYWWENAYHSHTARGSIELKPVEASIGSTGTTKPVGLVLSPPPVDGCLRTHPHSLCKSPTHPLPFSRHSTEKQWLPPFDQPPRPVSRSAVVGLADPHRHLFPLACISWSTYERADTDTIMNDLSQLRQQLPTIASLPASFIGSQRRLSFSSTLSFTSTAFEVSSILEEGVQGSSAGPPHRTLCIQIKTSPLKLRHLEVTQILLANAM